MGHTSVLLHSCYVNNPEAFVPSLHTAGSCATPTGALPCTVDCMRPSLRLTLTDTYSMLKNCTQGHRGIANVSNWQFRVRPAVHIGWPGKGPGASQRCVTVHTTPACPHCELLEESCAVPVAEKQHKRQQHCRLQQKQQTLHRMRQQPATSPITTCTPWQIDPQPPIPSAPSCTVHAVNRSRTPYLLPEPLLMGRVHTYNNASAQDAPTTLAPWSAEENSTKPMRSSCSV